MAQLFDPQKIAVKLGALPRLRAAIGDPNGEGSPSDGYPHARKTERQIYHILANSHFSHLDRLLEAIEFCLARGFAQPTLLKTRAAKPFAEAIGEVFAAEHFLREGYGVSGFGMAKGPHPVPDLRIRGHGLDLAIEVYSPRVWEDIGNLTDGLTEVVMNLDIPKDFRFEAKIEADYLSGERKFAIPDPFVISEALAGRSGHKLLVQLEEGLADALQHGIPVVEVLHKHGDLAVRTTISLISVRESEGRLPSRGGVIHGPTKSGFAPEGIFSRLVSRKVRAKAARRQAISHAHLSMLLVDLSYCDLSSELSNDFYRQEFERVLRKLDGLEGYDAICFVDSPAWQRELRMHFLARESGDANELARLLFPPASDRNGLSAATP